MTARKNTDSANSKDPSRRPHWRAAPLGMLAHFERLQEVAKKGGGSKSVRLTAEESAPATNASLAFVQRVMAQGYDLARDEIPTPACDSVAALRGAERRRAITQRGITTAVRFEETALAFYDARVAAGYRQEERVDTQEERVRDAARREAAIAARAREIAAEEFATQRVEVEAKALAQATAEFSRRGA
ncbi:MAG: hypothetical protein ACM3ZE_31795 [Myxococcales bacterium]